MTTFDKHQRDFIYRQVSDAAFRKWGPDIANGSMCFQWMECGLVYLRSQNVRAIPACGNAAFQLCEIKDGETRETHLSFEWQGDAENARAVPVKGEPLPEMHCYIWLPNEKQIVDFSTKYLPRFAEKIGFTFDPGFEPPDYHWGDPNRLAPRAIYIPNIDATKLAMQFMRQQKGIHVSRRLQ